MRRIGFYLAVALLAFGIGSFFAFGFHWRAEEKNIYEEDLNTTKKTQMEEGVERGFGTAFSERRLNEPVYVPKIHKPTCTDKNLLPIWNELRKDREFKESEGEFSQTGDCAELIQIERRDLNDDGQKEFIVWGRYTFCGGTGNCVIWIYEEKNSKYKQLLQSYAYYGESKWFEVKKSKSNGYHGLLLKTHFTGYETTHSIYKFDGRKYVEAKCWFEIYSMNEDNPSFMTCKEYTEKN